MSKGRLVNIGTKDFVNEKKIVFMNTFRKIVKHIKDVKIAIMKNVKKIHRKTCRDWFREACRRKGNCAYLHQDTKETVGKRMNQNTPNYEQSDVTEYYPKIICKLCDEGVEGNTEMKEHFIKEHVQDLNVLDAVNDCGYVFGMEISKEKCSKFCYFYKNLTELEEVTSGRVLP